MTTQNRKIGFFDSGLGGLVLLKAAREALPDYDMVYVGDTLHVPYGPRSAEAIYDFTQKAVRFLFEQDCHLIVIACNTASANALRRLQQEYLPSLPQDGRRVLGVIVPTLEAALDSKAKRIGLIATAFTIQSQTYPQELQKIDPEIEIFGKVTPLLVPLAENNGIRWSAPILEEYLTPLIEENIDSLILGCTHYPLFRKEIAQILPEHVKVIGQDEILPPKLVNYLERHPEMDARLSRKGSLRLCLTDLTPHYKALTEDLLGYEVEIEKVSI